MTHASGHRVEFRVNGPVPEELDELPGTAATRPDAEREPSVWSVTARDVAELHGILERMQSAGYTLISVDALE